jgi:hypothetical protein
MSSAELFLPLLEKGLVWTAESGVRSFSFSLRDDTPQNIPFGIPEIDALLPAGGLNLQAIHTFGFDQTAPTPHRASVPLVFPSVLARHRIISFWNHQKKDPEKQKREFPYLLVWIGRECWPSPLFLDELLSFSENGSSEKGKRIRLLQRCLFIAPRNDEERFWAIDIALRSPAIGFVVAACRKLPFTLSRRFTLAVRDHATVGIILESQPSKDQRCSATSVWRLTPLPSSDMTPNWRLSLERLKGCSPTSRQWQISFRGVGNEQENSTEAFFLHLLSPLVDRSSTSIETPRRFTTA